MYRKCILSCFLFLLISFTSGHAQHFYVTSNEDAGKGTLRAAIDSVNTRIGPDTISFLIPDITTTENGIISLQTPLPEITDPGLRILGTGQVFEFNEEETFRPDIQIWGGEIIGDTAVGLYTYADDVHIQYLLIGGFRGGGIVFDDVEIGSVSGCYIGIRSEEEPGKREVGTGDGIAIKSSTHILIGPSEIAPFGNIISGFNGNGISISDSSAFNALLGNEIGFNAWENQYFRSGNDMNGISISDDSYLNEVISNKVGQSSMHGIEIKNASQNFVVENQIGSAFEFSMDIGNLGSGIYLHDGAQLNHLIRNEVGHNGGYGIVNAGNSTIRNTITRNLISKNTMGGISNIGGGNSMLTAPELESLSDHEIKGSAGPHQIIEFFFDESNQGGIYVDSVIADAAGNFAIQLPPIPPNWYVTATTGDALGNTSEFSIPIKVNSIAEQTTFIVSTTADSGPGSFRSAIDSSNLHPGPDSIKFNIAKTDAGFDQNKGAWFIKPDSAFPLILDEGLFVDGSSQALYLGEDLNPAGPEIIISGENDNSFAAGLNIHGMATEVYAMTINNFNGPGISIYTPGFATISGCFIGTNYNGMQAAGNNDGIVLGYRTTNSLVGPSLYHPYGNIISGNKRIGILVVDSSQHHVIVANQIGTNRNNTDTIGNTREGISLTRSANYNEIFDNTIAGNFQGITLFDSKYNVIANNRIGLNGELKSGNQEAGIFLWMNSSQNLIMNNRIGFSGGYGIYNAGSGCIENLFSRNYFRNNKFGDILNLNGANLELDPPSGLILKNSILSGKAAAGQIIELYLVSDTSGTFYLDSLVAGAQGDFFYLFDTVPFDHSIVATARDAQGNTSQFSEPYNLTTSIKNETAPNTYLLDIQPNPASAETVINYMISQTSKVNLLLFDNKGIIVKKIIHNYQGPGKYRLPINLDGFTTGVYYVHLVLSTGYQEVKKLLIIR
ncbi:MAG: hypothetical protein HKN76_08755 [Saprospiraceae bacterium]|nr:hypothetical protein [Saprospiraceae bacterium]